MLFRLRFPIDVERPAGDLNDTVTANAEVLYRGGKWQGNCQEPPLITDLYDTLEQALVALAKEIARDGQPAPTS
jgi:hypothetical protein